MLQWLDRNKDPLSLALNAIDCQELNLSGTECRLCSSLIDILAPIEQATIQGSHGDVFSHVGLVIPIIQSLRTHFLPAPGQEKVTFKTNLYDSLNTRYSKLFDNGLYLCGTVLDPRFKAALLDFEARAKAKQIIRDQLGATPVTESDHPHP